MKIYGSNWVKGHRGQRSFFSVGHAFFCLFPYFSQVLGPILKVKVIKVKGQISVSRQSLVRFA